MMSGYSCRGMPSQDWPSERDNVTNEIFNLAMRIEPIDQVNNELGIAAWRVQPSLQNGIHDLFCELCEVLLLYPPGHADHVMVRVNPDIIGAHTHREEVASRSSRCLLTDRVQPP